MKMKDASSLLGKRFAGATTIKETPTGEKEVQIQGDWRHEIEDALEALLGVPRKKVTVDASTGQKKIKEPKEIAAQPDRGAPP
jgi:translation initiation factor 1 (eIF-1/SUI1)